MIPPIKFYRTGNVWHLDQYDALPAGCWSRTFDDVGRVVVSLLPPYSNAPNGNVYITGLYSDFCDATGTPYPTQDAFDAATNEFFIGDGKTVKLSSLADTSNSYCGTLNANGKFIGEWSDALEYGTITIGVTSSVDSSTNGLRIEYSMDASVVVQDDHYTIIGGIGKVFTVTPANRYYRINYTNGPSGQANFCIESILRTASIKPSSHRIADPIVSDDDAELMKAVITGVRDDGVFGNATLDNENRIQVSSQPYLYGVAEGTIGGHNSLLKPGIRTSIAANTTSTVWEGTTALYQYLASASTVSIVSTNAADSSTGTGARSVTVTGLDASCNEQTEKIATNGTNAVTTTKSFLRVFCINVETCGTSDTNVGIITAIATTGGTQLSVIPAGDGESIAAVWTVPLGKIFYITRITVSNDSGKGSRFALLTRQMDGGIRYPWRVKFRAYFLGGIQDIPFDIPFRIPEKTDIELRFLTDANAGTIRGGASFSGWYEDEE